MSDANEPTLRIRPRLRETMPGTTILVTFRAALLREDEGGQSTRSGRWANDEGEDAHVDLDDVDHVLVGEVLEEGRLVVALADVVDCANERGQDGQARVGSTAGGERTEDTDVERVESRLESGIVGLGVREVDGVDLRLDRRVLGGCGRRGEGQRRRSSSERLAAWTH